MITANQLRAARALLNIDQRQTADLAGLSVPTIQRMEACEGTVRVVVDSLEKVMNAFADAGVVAHASRRPPERRRTRRAWASYCGAAGP